MSLTLPDLDDRTYAELRDEALALLPGLDADWTNHNPTDPGITLVELFAWLTEMLIFRVNRLPKDNVRTFLRLLNGPGWQPGVDLDEDIRAAVADLRRRHRAVTPADYELLAREASPGVARARCVPLRNLAALVESERETPRAGHVSVILVPAAKDWADPASWDRGAPLPGEDLIDTVRAYLEPRRLLTVRQSVAAPVYAPVAADVVVVRRPDAPEAPLRDAVRAAIEDYLDPLTGGPEERGWPFGRDVYVSEVYQLLERIPGVDFVTDVRLTSALSADLAGVPRLVAAAELWHDSGDPVGLGLGAHHLPWARIDPGRIVVAAATSLVPARVEVTVAPQAQADLAQVRRQVKETVRALFHPLEQGPDGQEEWTITAAAVNAAVVGVAGVADASTQIHVDPRWYFHDGASPGLKTGPREQVNAEIRIAGI